MHTNGDEGAPLTVVEVVLLEASVDEETAEASDSVNILVALAATSAPESLGVAGQLCT